MGKDVHKAKKVGQRILRTTGKPSAVAGNRLRGIPEEIALDYNVYAQYLPQNQGEQNNG